MLSARDAFASVTKKAVVSNCAMLHQKSKRGQKFPSAPWRTLNVICQTLPCSIFGSLILVLGGGAKKEKNQNAFLTEVDEL